MLVRPSVIDCCCSFWNTNELCSAVASKSARVFKHQRVFGGEGQLLLALDVEHSEKSIAVADGDAKNAARTRQQALQLAGLAGIHHGHFASAGHPSHNPRGDGNLLSFFARGSSGLDLDLNLFGRIVENADADVVEAKILLDVADDFGQHLLGVFAGNRSLGNAVQERKLARTALLFAEQPGVFNGHRNLAGGGLQHVQVARLEDVFVGGAQGNHDPGGLSVHQDGRGTERFRGRCRLGGYAQPLAHMLEIGANQQRLPGAQNVFGQSVIGLALPARPKLSVFHFQMEGNRVALPGKPRKNSRCRKSVPVLFAPCAARPADSVAS